MRTLEQKISDAGPNPQRVDPHVLTKARNLLRDNGVLAHSIRKGVPYYHLLATPQQEIDRRLQELGAVHDRTADRSLTVRLGQTLEIAIFRALKQRPEFTFLGGFPDLSDHDDSALYRKEEPPTTVSGRSSSGPVDFLVLHPPPAGLAAIEAKNVREWMYPDRPEIIDLLWKSVQLDAVPVLIARRIPYVTFSILNPAGVLFHQVFNQLYPDADAETASLAKDKNLLGYHDIRLGNTPDQRLRKFLLDDLPTLLPKARACFDEYKDLLTAFGSRDMAYQEFAGRLRRRQRGEVEDGPPEWFEDPEL